MKILLYFSLFITPIIIHSQNKELDFEYFLYGINHCYFEYGNREFKGNQVDVFFEDLFKEDIIAEFLNKKIEKDSIDYVIIKRIDKGPNFTNDRDDNLSQYYMFSELIENGLKENFDEKFLYKEKLKLDKKKAHSFLTGAYLRSGFKINDTLYKVSIFSSSKPEKCYSVLKYTNSTNVVYKIRSQEKDRFINPKSTVYFNPSNELKKYFDLVKNVPSVTERLNIYFSDYYLEKILSEKDVKKIKKIKEEFAEFKTLSEKGVKEMNLEDIKIVEELLNE
ncbi:hypothetical protein MPF19_08290 [Polaribacter sp. Z014]|uniref:hypothetical protein n=1 Tax=Polaribacter sp. Z014 TaxID=2927126 RepID=UPI00202290F5|nr:hypothetical protein [Polaribacter sp. Z014]MCL7763408.1 hypothetical protein [Polaribacter sp. Z014]